MQRRWHFVILLVLVMGVVGLLWHGVHASPEISKQRLWLEAMEKVLSRAKVVAYPSKSDAKFNLTQVE